MVNMEKSQLYDVFEFVGNQCDPKDGHIRPTLDCWEMLNVRIQKLHSKPSQCKIVNSYRKLENLELEKQLEGTRITRKGDPCQSTRT